MSGHWDEKAIFLLALDLEGDALQSLLAQSCENEAQRERIRRLLSAHKAARSGEMGESLLGATGRGSGVDVPEDDGNFDEFRIVRKIGAGGMARVYLAHDEILDRPVALKVLARDSIGSEHAFDWFVREAKHAGGLRHPAIVTVYKFGQDRGRAYIASEYIEGPTFCELIEQESGRLGSNTRTQTLRSWFMRVAEIIATVSDALQHAHKHGVIHRDVKPSNILIDRDRARLTDFGIALTVTDEAAIGSAELVGSCHYMSPEQAAIAQRTIDQRSDVFSLGVTLYQALAFERPFEGSNVHQVLEAIVTCAPRQLRSVSKRVPKDLETICHKALERNPENRYQSAAHMAADLRCFIDGRPILARPPSLIRRCTMWFASHQAAALTLIGIVGITVLLLLAYRLHESRLASQGRLTIRTSRPADVFASPLDHTAGVQRTKRLGRTPFDSVYTTPGLYLLTAIDDRGAFCEGTVYLERSGASKDKPTENVLSLTLLLPEHDFDQEMVLVPQGTLHRSEALGGPLEMQAFWIDRAEVTNKQFGEFMKATGHPPPHHWSNPAEGLVYREDHESRPVVGITVADAAAYAHWAGKRLPTEWEWEYAMRAPDGRAHPWHGSVPEFSPVADGDTDRARQAEWKTGLDLYDRYVLPSVSRPDLATPLGVLHGLSNVEEITASMDLARGAVGIKRGLSWLNSGSGLTVSHRSGFPTTTASLKRGFRCVRSLDHTVSQ